MPKSCIFKPYINCEKCDNCKKCGWNPKVEEQRKAKLNGKG